MFPHSGKYSYKIPHEYWLQLTEEKIIRLCLCHTIFITFLSCMYHKLKKCLNSRSRHQRCSIEQAILKNFAIFTGKHLWWTLFFNRVAGLKTCSCIKRASNKGVFLCILKKFFKKLFSRKAANNCFCSSCFLLLIFFLEGFLLLLIQYISFLQGPL